MAQNITQVPPVNNDTNGKNMIKLWEEEEKDPHQMIQMEMTVVIPNPSRARTTKTMRITNKDVIITLPEGFVLNKDRRLPHSKITR
ncbi:hypothetical protein P8452_54538 [Trifolium repens]|jgi:hypothetical protein|nr:hypothetical protein QL285_079213 [Trifolium repens]WJX70424.1 hypothetical protein P8452_54538 [Trifolium repens]